LVTHEPRRHRSKPTREANMKKLLTSAAAALFLAGALGALAEILLGHEVARQHWRNDPGEALD
jgi:hypothetical protein